RRDTPRPPRPDAGWSAPLPLDSPCCRLSPRPRSAPRPGWLGEKGGGGAFDARPPLTPVQRTDGVPLSFAQERLWLVEQLEPGTPLYNVPLALRLRGGLDPRRLAGALSGLARRHRGLRTAFPPVEGRAVQRAGAAAPRPPPGV